MSDNKRLFGLSETASPPDLDGGFDQRGEENIREAGWPNE